MKYEAATTCENDYKLTQHIISIGKNCENGLHTALPGNRWTFPSSAGWWRQQ